jgi:hypothetical protein
MEWIRKDFPIIGLTYVLVQVLASQNAKLEVEITEQSQMSGFLF